MKTLSICLVLAVTAGGLHAQRELEHRLSADIRPAPAQFGQVSENDKRVVISKVTQLLGQHVTFRKHEVSASAYEASDRSIHHVEWRGLRISMLVPTQLKATDKEEGIDKRIQAMLVFDSCRILNPKTNNWTPWARKGHPLFPPAINIYWKNGHPMADGGMHLPKFRPGPIDTPASAVINPLKTPGPTTPATGPTTGPTSGGGGIQRGTGNNGGLPPGMQRK